MITNRVSKYVLLLSILLSVSMLLSSCSSMTGNKRSKSSLNKLSQVEETNHPDKNSGENNVAKPTPKIIPRTLSSNVKLPAGAFLTVSYLDVGQADSVLITTKGAAMLIDAGNNSDGAGIVSYLKNKGITKLDYVIGTHPHEDHIGGLDDVISAFNIGKIIMPKVPHNTNTFEDVLDAISGKGLKVTQPKVGDKYKLDKAEFEILSPADSSYSELNEYSIVIRLTFGAQSFLFCGDADDANESAILGMGENIKSSVIKIGHHGSASSSMESFIKKVDPKYAVISVGEGNSYGHPTQQTLNTLNSFRTKIYRTDKLGTVIISTNGKTLNINSVKTSIDGNSYSSTAKDNTPKATPKPKPKPHTNTVSAITVYITNTGEKYHRDGCQYLSHSQIPISLTNAKNQGYTPCSRCDPPY